uniref:Uncharacterized protein n=1 Tax=Anguilla anguilla TaxID=7936 RepID=A0A0E9PA92_ANGAN
MYRKISYIEDPRKLMEHSEIFIQMTILELL